MKNKNNTNLVFQEKYESYIIENEGLKFVRVADNKELSTLLYKDKWAKKENSPDLSEWGDTKIIKLLKDNSDFRKGIVNLFFEGSTTPFLAQTLPLFELKKLSISRKVNNFRHG
jgi:hypothetical protein